MDLRVCGANCVGCKSTVGSCLRLQIGGSDHGDAIEAWWVHGALNDGYTILLHPTSQRLSEHPGREINSSVIEQEHHTVRMLQSVAFEKFVQVMPGECTTENHRDAMVADLFLENLSSEYTEMHKDRSTLGLISMHSSVISKRPPFTPYMTHVVSRKESFGLRTASRNH